MVDDCTSKTVVIGAGPTAGQAYEASYEEYVYDQCTGDEHAVQGFASPTVFECSGVGQLRRAYLVADIPLDDGRVVHVDELFVGIGAVTATLGWTSATTAATTSSTQLERYREARASGTVTAWRAYLAYARQGLLTCASRASPTSPASSVSLLSSGVRGWEVGGWQILPLCRTGRRHAFAEEVSGHVDRD